MNIYLIDLTASELNQTNWQISAANQGHQFFGAIVVKHRRFITWFIWSWWALF